MNFKIHSHNIDLHDDDRRYAEEKALRLERHFGRIHDGRMELSADALRRPEPVKLARIHIHLAGGDVLKAEGEGKGIREAVDLVLDKMDEQLRRHKERLTARSRLPEKLAGS